MANREKSEGPKDTFYCGTKTKTWNYL